MEYLKQGKTAAQKNTAQEEVTATVGGILKDIEERGDKAIRECSARFDKWSPDSFLLSEAEN